MNARNSVCYIRRLFAAMFALWISVTVLDAQTGIAAGPTPVGLDQYRPFVRGDANVDGNVDIGDPVRILEYLFPTGPAVTLATLLPCRDAADCNDDDTLDIGDPIYLLTHLFTGGDAPPAPFPDCGDDPTSGLLISCNSYPPCAGFTDDDTAGHVLRRVAYGATPNLLDQVIAMGAEEYILEQLDPASIDESSNDRLNDLMATLVPQTSRNDLYRMHFARGLYSEKQLLEQLVDFWNNHFNTYYWTLRNHFWFELSGLYNNSEAQVQATILEHTESETFRDLALTTFEDLLVASATSPAMVIYLDSDNNVVGNPNENYAREVMELHSLGDDVVYVQNDIIPVARCFTGWTVCKKAPADYGDPHAPCLLDTDPTGVWSFHFEPGDHDYDEKVIFAGTPHELVIPAGDAIGNPEGGLDDGLAMLAKLASMPETAEFISGKLIKKFVSDTVPPALLADCIGSWLATGGDLHALMSTILLSDEFLGTANRWDKLETPMESVLSTVRAYDGTTDTWPVLGAIADMSHLPHNFFTPDGFPEVDSLGTQKLLYRVQFNARIYLETNPSYDLALLLSDYGVDLNSASDIVDYFIRVQYQSNVTTIDRQLAIDFLSSDESGTPTALDPMAADYDNRLETVAAFIASYPQAVQQ